MIAFKEGKLEHINVLKKMIELLGEQRFKNSLLCRMYSFPIGKIIVYEPIGVALEKEKNFVITEETKKMQKKCTMYLIN